MPTEAWILVLLIVALTAGVISFVLIHDHLERKRAERRRCPICRGGDRRTIYREQGFYDWCEEHRGSWWGPSVWDPPQWTRE